MRPPLGTVSNRLYAQGASTSKPESPQSVLRQLDDLDPIPSGRFATHVGRPGPGTTGGSSVDSQLPLPPSKPPRFSGRAKPGGAVTGSCDGGCGSSGACGDGVWGVFLVATITAQPMRPRVHRITSATRNAQLVARQSESEAILRRLVYKWDSTHIPAARYASITLDTPRWSLSARSVLPRKANTKEWGSRIQMALPTHRAKETIASTPNTPREPWPVLAPKNEPAIEAAASTVPARALKPESARSCSASALAVNSKLSCSIDSATPRFYRLPWTVFDAYARTTLARCCPYISGISTRYPWS